jgi:hypothetical protein
MSSAYSPSGSAVPQMQLSLQQGPQLGQSFSLSRPSILIGRGTGNDVTIDDSQVSRRHANITWDGQQFIINDLGSSNGTFVNGVRLTGPRVLQPGDTIGLGSTIVLGFQLGAPAYAAPPPAPPGMAYPPAADAAKGGGFPLLLGLGVGGVLVLLIAAAVIVFLVIGRPKPSPTVVLIDEPRQGEEVSVGEGVTVHAVARNEKKVQRIELWVDGALVASQSSTLPGGTSPLPILAQWQPTSAGSHTIVARAFTKAGKQAQASINVQAVADADRDGDGIPDAEDASPDEPGSIAAAGSPDRDNDGIGDAEDACPDEAGLPEENGCPAPSERDRDGDGVADEEDLCPDEAGAPGAQGCPDADGDGVGDAMDACPTEPGLQEDGCPPADDADGDGVPDAADACPDEAGEGEDGCPLPAEADTDGDGVLDADDQCVDVAGPPELNGCPDADGDGVPDIEDLCPAEAGDPANAGCPPPPAGDPDTDGDGLLDSVDLCTFEPGPPEHGGCPPPAADPPAADPPWPWPLWPPPWGIDPGIMESLTTVEFDALTLETALGYDYLSCYVGVAGGEKVHYIFDNLGAGQWDIAAELGGANSQTLIVTAGSPLELEMECGAVDLFIVPGGVEWHYRDLGTILASHPDTDWDGHVIASTSAGGDDGRSFTAGYRLCAGSCGDTTFPPPVATIYHNWMGYFLVWEWAGDPADIDGFRIYLDGALVETAPNTGSATYLGGTSPICGAGALRYTVRAYRGALESAPSNVATWQSVTCAAFVRVTFHTLNTGVLGPDEWWAEGRGPIYAQFWAVGANSEVLYLDAADPGFGWMPQVRGFRLVDNQTYLVQDLFDWVHWYNDWCMGPACGAYTAPAGNSVDVELSAFDDLILQFSIADMDSGPNQLICAHALAIPSGAILPGTYELNCGSATLWVQLEMLPMP